MKICLVGGIYDKEEEYRATVKWTPETTLEHGLREAGHDVATRGHQNVGPLDEFDIVHVHHLARGAITAALDVGKPYLVYTGHNTPAGILRNAGMQLLCLYSDALVALSRTQACSESRFAGLPAVRRVIPNGISVPHLWPLRRTVPRDGRWNLLYSGQLIQHKRLDLLLTAMSHMSSTYNLSLTVASHNLSLQPNLIAQARDLGLAQTVHFLGPVSQEKIADLYRSCHLLVLPSEEEFLPQVIAEALLCATPVVATAVGAVPEQVSPGQGIVVDPGSLSALIDGLRGAIECYAVLASGAFDMSSLDAEKYAPRTMIAAHIDLYRELLSVGGAPRRLHACRPIVNSLMRGLIG